MFGFENIVRTVPRSDVVGHLSEYQKTRRAIRSALVGAGCDEIMPMPFLAPGDLSKAGMAEEGVSLTNPLVQEESILSTSLMPAHLKVIAFNQSHRSGQVKFFEVGHVFLPSAEDQLLPDERERLAVAISDADASAAVDILNLLDSTLALPNVQLRPATPAGMHPTRSAEIVIAGKVRGYVGEVDPDVCKAFNVDGRVAFAEIEWHFENEITMQRQIILSMEDKFAWIGDAVNAPRSVEIDYRCQWQLADAMCTVGESENTEGYLFDGKKMRALVISPAASEWKSGPSPAKLQLEKTDFTLTVKRRGRHLYAPVFIDLSPKRCLKPRTWRQLTVAQSLEIVDDDVAVAYRVAVGKKQFVFYRSMASPANRTFFGENVNTEMFFGRLEKTGVMTELVQIE
jgi:hypothetical protein